MLEEVQDRSQVMLMFFLRFGVYKDVVDKDYNKLFEVRATYAIHYIHEDGRGVSKTKWHNREFEETIPGSKGSLWDVTVKKS